MQLQTAVLAYSGHLQCGVASGVDQQLLASPPLPSPYAQVRTVIIKRVS